MSPVERAGPAFAWHFDAKGAPGQSDPAEEAPADGLRWLSFDGASPEQLAWLRERGLLDSAIEALTPGNDPRPALQLSGGRVVLSLRTAVGGEADAAARVEPLLLVAQEDLVVTVRDGPLAAIEELEVDPAGAGGISDTGTLVALIVERCIDALEPAVDATTEQMDLLEERLLARTEDSLVAVLGLHRRAALHLHRRIAPQREVLHRLAAEAPEWMDDHARARIARAAEACGRMLDDVQAARDHAALVQDEIGARQNERLNRRLYLFTVIASVFLPLTFFTGLLGANVEGIPFSTATWAFGAVVALCVAIASVQYLVIRWFRLL